MIAEICQNLYKIDNNPLRPMRSLTAFVISILPYNEIATFIRLSLVFNAMIPGSSTRAQIVPQEVFVETTGK